MADPTWEESTDAAPNPTAPVPVAAPEPTWDDSRAAPEPKEPDMSAVKSDITSNLKATQPEPKAPPADGSLPTPADYTPPPVTPEKSVTDSVTEAIQRGFNMSTTGLRMLGKIDDTPDPRNAQWYYGVAKAAGQMYGDIPEMLEGMVGGAAAGSAVPVVGTIAGGIAGSFALPAMVRKHLMDQYSKGGIQTFQDFYTRAGGMLLEGSKAATVGLATTAVGGKVGEGLAEAAYPAITQTAGRLAAEVVTMGNAGAVMDGHAPQADDFITAGALMVGLHAGGAGASFMADHADRVSGKMRDIYEQTGVLPHNALADAKNDPYTHQEIISSNVTIPKKYENLVEESPPNSPEAHQVVQVDPPKNAEPLPPLSKSFSDPMGVTVPEKGPYEPEELPAAASGSGGEEPPKLDQDVQEFQDRIQPSSGKSPEDTAGLYERTIRQLKPIDDMVKELGGDKLRPSQNPAILAQLHTGVLRKATYFIMPRGGAFDFKTLEDTGVRSLSDINSDAMKADPSNPKGFMTFEVAQQTIAEDARGRETGMNLDTAKKIVADGQDKYGDLAKEKSVWRNSVFKYLADSGVISQEHYANALIANSEYVPMNRVLGDEAVASGGKGLTVKSPVRKRMGSDRIIQDPNESDIKNVINYVMQAEKNRVGQALVNLAQREGGESFLQEVPAKNRPIAIFGSDLDQMIKQSGGGGEMMGVDPDEKLGDVWRPADVRANPKTQIQVMFDGKPRVFDADPGILRAFTGMDEGSRGIAINLASSIANTLRAGYTALSPAFALTHTLRQQLGAAPIFSEHTTLPFVGLVQGVLEMNRMGPAMREFMKTGAGSDTIASATRDFIQAKDLYDLDQNHNTGVIDSRSNVVKSPLEAGFWSMKNMLAASEAARSLTKKVTDMSPIHKAIVNGDEGTRVTEFKKTLGDSTDIDSKLRAAMAARKVLADISQTGSAMGPLNRITPFFNAATQNMAALGEAIKANPAQTMVRLGALVTTPAMISYALNHDKEWWDKMEPWEKFGFLHFEVDGHIVKIPLGESGRLAAGLPIAVLDSIRQKNPGIIADWAKETLLGMVPSVTPIVKPSLEQWGNKSFLTGAPLIPKAMEENTPYPYQTKPTTSALATLYGRAAQHVPGLRDSSFSSPIIADNYGQSWGGAAYGLSNYLLDKGIYASGALPDPQKPEKNWDQNPFVKSFFLSQDSISDENISTFETDAHKTQKYLNVAKTLAPKDPSAAEALINSSEYSEHALNIKGIQGAISAQSKVIRTVEANPNISPVDKKVIIDGAVKQMDAAAKQGNEILQQYRKAIRADQ